MCPALPGAEYYGASAPPAALSRQRACPLPGRMPGSRGDRKRFPRSLHTDQPGRHPAVPRQPRHGYAAGLHRGLPGQRC